MSTPSIAIEIAKPTAHYHAFGVSDGHASSMNADRLGVSSLTPLLDPSPPTPLHLTTILRL